MTCVWRRAISPVGSGHIDQCWPEQHAHMSSACLVTANHAAMLLMDPATPTLSPGLLS